MKGKGMKIKLTFPQTTPMPKPAQRLRIGNTYLYIKNKDGKLKDYCLIHILSEYQAVVLRDYFLPIHEEQWIEYVTSGYYDIRKTLHQRYRNCMYNVTKNTKIDVFTFVD
jgi:hypothetical protein